MREVGRWDGEEGGTQADGKQTGGGGSQAEVRSSRRGQVAASGSPALLSTR